MSGISSERARAAREAVARSSVGSRASILAAWLCVSGCGPVATAPDADAQPDAVYADVAAPDASDAGCTALASELPGERRIAIDGLLPDATFATSGGTFAWTDYHVPCATRAELLVVRSITTWSGHSLWHVTHTGRLASHPSRARLHLIDLLAAGIDALPARPADRVDLEARYDVRPDVVALDPDEWLAPLAPNGARLPVVVLVDARSLHVETVLFAPVAGEIEHAIDVVLARLDGLSAPSPFVPTLVDGRFTEDQAALIAAMAYPATPPPDPSNAHADDPAAAALGASLIDDVGLSPAAIACTHCHVESLGLADGRALAHGIGDTTRNTPTVFASAFLRWPFWDGRTDSLWAQALGPIENPVEMGSSRLFVAHYVATQHRAAYESVFGPLPDLSDPARFPATGAPGQASWDAMAPADQALVNRIFSNVGKAIEADERLAIPPHTRFDAYVGGDTSALTAAERDGLRDYVQSGCADCHYGPSMSDGAFHALGVPGSGSGSALDLGRSGAFDALAHSPFRRQGAFSDDPGADDPLVGRVDFGPTAVGAFRTPTLRAVPLTAPYGHAGTVATLREAVDYLAHVRDPSTPDPRVAGSLDAHVVGFDAARVDSITTFLSTL